MPADNQRARWLAFLLLAGCLVLAGWAYLSRERPLLDVATRHAQLGRWGDSVYPYYWWLSDQEIAVFRSAAKEDWQDTARWKVLRQNVDTGEQTPLPGLTDVFNRSEGMPWEGALSPDGKWLLWTGKENRIFCATLDGSQFRRAFKRENMEDDILWLDDSRRWVEFRREQKGGEQEGGRYITTEIGNLDDASQAPETLPIVAGSPFNISEDIDVGNAKVQSPTHMVLPETRWEQDPVRTTRIFELSPSRAAMSIQEHTIDLPRAAEGVLPYFSPSGDRIAWVFDYRRTAPWGAWFRRFLPFAPDSRQEESLWVSRADGTQMREIGYVEIMRTDGEDEYDDDIGSVEWTPDGKHLGFLYRRVFYTVPAD
jgi:hypothetical protein